MKIKLYTIYGSSLLFCFYVLGFVLFCLYAISLKYAQHPNADAIVVLTGDAGRIQLAFEMLEANKADKLFISGVNAQVSVGALYQQLTESMAQRVELGYKADNTYENALETQDFLSRNHVKSILLVTSFYHMPRSLLEMKSRQAALKVYPVSVFPSIARSYPRHIYLLFSEYNKSLFVAIRSLCERII